MKNCCIIIVLIYHNQAVYTICRCAMIDETKVIEYVYNHEIALLHNRIEKAFSISKYEAPELFLDIENKITVDILHSKRGVSHFLG